MFKATWWALARSRRGILRRVGTSKRVARVAGPVIAALLLAGSIAPTTSSGADAPVSVPVDAMTMCPPAPPGVLNSAPSVPSGAKTVALTFDDGPGVTTTPVLKILRDYGVRATFMNVDTYYTAQLREIANGGYLLGDHSGDHHEMTSLARAQQLDEVQRVIAQTFELTSRGPCVFRPPYGSYNGTTIAVARQLNVGFWMWSVGTGDFLAEGSGSLYWVRHIRNAALDGTSQAHPVILMHDQVIMDPALLAALPTIITTYQRLGYVFVDLLGRYGPPNTCLGKPNGMLGDASTTLDEGSSLASGASLVTPSGQFTLTMEVNGDLVLHVTDGRSLWSSGTSGDAGATAQMGVDGVLRVLSPDGSVLWASSTGPTSATSLAIGDSGDMATEGPSGSTWTSDSSYTTMRSGDRLRSGWSLFSARGRCRLTMTALGALRVVSVGGEMLWNNQVRVGDGAFSALTTSGDLVTVNAGTPVWSSRTAGHRGDTMIVTDTGYGVLRSPSRHVIWSTP